MFRLIRLSTVIAALWMILPSVGHAQPMTSVESLSQFSIDELFSRLIVADRKSSKDFEDQVERREGAIVTGTIAELDPGREGAFFIWLRNSERKTVGRFMLRAGYTTGVEKLRVGQEARLACEIPYRSTSGHVSSFCRIP